MLGINAGPAYTSSCLHMEPGSCRQNERSKLDFGHVLSVSSKRFVICVHDKRVGRPAEASELQFREDFVRAYIRSIVDGMMSFEYLRPTCP